MPSPDYYRRQATSTLNLARTATNAGIKRHFTQLASDYVARAEQAALDQLDAFIAKSHVGVTCLTRRD
jgi:hypothetical protein